MAGMKTISEQVYQTLYEGIISGQIRPGSKLTLRSIQDSLGVSSSPIREALTRLSEDGLILYQPNVGMTVISLTWQDASEILALTEEFDVIALRFAWDSDKREDMLMELNHVLKNGRDAIDEGRDKEWIELSDEFHNVLFKYSGNSRLADAADKNRKQLSILSRHYQQSEDNKAEIQAEHTSILKALESGDIGKAEELMRSHLRSSAHKSLELFTK